MHVNGFGGDGGNEGEEKRAGTSAAGDILVKTALKAFDACCVQRQTT